MNSMIMRVKCAVLGSDGRNEEVTIRDNSKGKKAFLFEQRYHIYVKNYVIE